MHALVGRGNPKQLQAKCSYLPNNCFIHSSTHLFTYLCPSLLLFNMFSSRVLQPVFGLGFIWIYAVQNSLRVLGSYFLDTVFILFSPNMYSISVHNLQCIVHFSGTCPLCSLR